jgi:hypothetical protein
MKERTAFLAKKEAKKLLLVRRHSWWQPGRHTTSGDTCGFHP